MTLDEDLATKRKVDEMALSEHLTDALSDAIDQSRLTCGIYEGGQLLEINPDGVMLCILPVNTTNDDDVHIYHTLIEALCWQNSIRLIKVDTLECVADLFAMKASSAVAAEAAYSETERRDSAICPFTDFNCALIEYPDGDLSTSEVKLMDFHRDTYDLSPQPVISVQV